MAKIGGLVFFILGIFLAKAMVIDTVAANINGHQKERIPASIHVERVK